MELKNIMSRHISPNYCTALTGSYKFMDRECGHNEAQNRLTAPF